MGPPGAGCRILAPPARVRVLLPVVYPSLAPFFLILASINGAPSVKTGAARGRKGAAHLPGKGSVGDKSVALGGSGPS
jgi:hypothetical protein